MRQDIFAVNYQHIGRIKAAKLIAQHIGTVCGRKVPRVGWESRIWSDGRCHMYVKNDGGRFVLYHVELP